MRSILAFYEIDRAWGGPEKGDGGTTPAPSSA